MLLKRIIHDKNEYSFERIEKVSWGYGFKKYGLNSFIYGGSDFRIYYLNDLINGIRKIYNKNIRISFGYYIKGKPNGSDIKGRIIYFWLNGRKSR